MSLCEGLVKKIILHCAFDFFARFPAAKPLLESAAARVNVGIQVLVNDARSWHQNTLRSGAYHSVLVAILGSVLGFLASGIFASAEVVARIGKGCMGKGRVVYAHIGMVTVRVNDAAVNDLQQSRLRKSEKRIKDINDTEDA